MTEGNERAAARGFEPIWFAVMNSVRSMAPLVVVAVLGAATAGCSNYSSADDEAAASADSSSVQAATSATPPLAAAGTDRKIRRPDPDATAIALTDIAVERQGDHDQAVLGFTGAAVPGWAVQYVDTPIQNGTGEALPLPGQSILEVLVLETPGPFTNAVGYSGPPVVFNEDTPQINTVQFAAQGAGITQVFITINGNRPPFAVSSSSNPTRIVIDVAD
jgi:hypothetical protein